MFRVVKIFLSANFYKRYPTFNNEHSRFDSIHRRANPLIENTARLAKIASLPRRRPVGTCVFATGIFAISRTPPIPHSTPTRHKRVLLYFYFLLKRESILGERWPRMNYLRKGSLSCVTFFGRLDSLVRSER